MDYTEFFTEVLLQTTKLGGNTSDNACVVGAIIGGAVGLNSLPRDSVAKLLFS